MRIGEANISGIQRETLREVMASDDEVVAQEALLRIIHDDDILLESEDLHPQWLEIYELYKDTIRNNMPLRAFRNMESFFAKLVPWDLEVESLDPGNMCTVFVLGAGASKPPPSNIPTVRELLPQLLERGRRLDREDVNSLADFCEQRRIDNIEDLLTAAQIASFCSRSPTILRLLNFLLYRQDDNSQSESMRPFIPRRAGRVHSIADVSSVAFLQDTLQVLFGLLASTMLPAKPNLAHEAIAKYASSHTGSAIVTTNYDCCMDLALEDVNRAIEYGVRFAGGATQREKSATSLIKLHGSLNWYYCETCQEVQNVDIRKLVQQYSKDESPYTVIGICKGCGGQRRGLLVPPLAMKFDVAPPLTPLLENAKKCFEEADLIVVIGFSFAEADVHISRMLSKSMQIKASQKLIVVDPQDDAIARVRRKLKASIPNLDDSRIIRIRGDCAELIPQFLSGKLKKHSTGKDRASHRRAATKRPSTAGSSVQG